ncbi:chitinase CLP-like [Triticum aestivum]|uniref:chitinase CLP-like n=1 Tax=Triticum aestivum TaxID=4565 RepID=UPI001D00E403|nr:chitinase CLP-like [Triticum aestivum]
MWQPKCLILVAVSLSVLACTAAGDGGGRSLVTAVTKDATTSLYTIPVKSGRPLVLDLSGPIVWSTCDDGAPHDTLECNNIDCMCAHRFHPPSCPHTGYGMPDVHNPYRCKCTPHPHNSVSGDTASGDMTRVALSANATDGMNPLGPVSFTAVTSCAPDTLLQGLPVGAVGVAGLARSSLAFPAQVAGTQGVANSFALCLSSSPGNGVAIFGGGPLFVLGQPISEMLGSNTHLRKYKDSPGYYIMASKGITMDGVQILPGEHAPLTIGLSTTTPYTELRSDVYRPFINVFDQAMECWGAAALRVPFPAASPFELCYNNSKLPQKRFGFFVLRISLMLDGGTSWPVFGMNSVVRLNRGTPCLAFVEMKAGNKAGYGDGAAPAVVIGSFQMENMLLVIDEEKQTLGFTTGQHLNNGLSCGHFNFTMPA